MEWLSGFLDWLGGQLNTVLSWLCAVLPDSPFKLLDYSPIASILPTINYFVPVDFILSVTSAWLACILVYYGYSILMRWAKALS